MTRLTLHPERPVKAEPVVLSRHRSRATDRPPELLHRMSALLRACNDAAGAAPTESIFFSALCRSFGEIGGYRFAAIWIAGEKNAATHIASGWGLNGRDTAGFHARALDQNPFAALIGRAIAQKRPMVVRADDAGERAIALALATHHLGALAVLPFSDRRDGHAALVLGASGEFSLDETNFAGALVNLTGFVTQATRMVRHHALLLSIFPVAVFQTDKSGNCGYISEWWRQLTGQPASDALGRGWLEMVHPDDRPRIALACRRPRRSAISSLKCRLLTRSGETRRVILQMISERETPDAPENVLGTIADVTEQFETRKDLEDTRAIIDQSPVVLYRHRAADDFPVIYVSKNIERFGYSVADALAGDMRYPDYIHEQDRAAVVHGMERLISGESDFFEHDYRIIASDGSSRWVHDSATPVRDDSGRLIAIQGTLIDITDRKAQEEQIANLLTCDRLTGLLNRASFSERLSVAIANLTRTGASFAVHLLGLDHFKDINDTLGHEAGDMLLRIVADRLTKALRVTDVIAHMGGDQFAILQSTLNESVTSGMVATRLLGEIAKPVSLEGHDIRITASIGIVICDRPGLETGHVLRDVDAALNRAKDEGRNRFRVHTDEINRTVRERVTLLEELRHALERDELLLYYQPQFDIRDGSICGAEALLRWQHPERGLILPGKFIRIAEITGLIVPIGAKVLRDAIRQMKLWLDEGVAPATMSIAINLSAIQFKTATIEGDVLKAIEDFGLPPERLELEVTETVFMEILDNGENVLTRLQRCGIKVAIDDFGTGYSSLAYVKWLHGTRLKIAQEFVRDIPSDPISSAVVRAVIAMAREIGIDFIAEGVEHEDQAEFLRGLGCYQIQGFLYGRPMPAAALTELLRRSRTCIGQETLPALS